MKKSYFFKFFVFALVGALAILPSCKDYDDDISRLDNEISKLSGVKADLDKAVADLNTSIASAKASAEAAQKTADAAKAAADAGGDAKAVADAAKAAADQAAADAAAAADTAADAHTVAEAAQAAADAAATAAADAAAAGKTAGETADAAETSATAAKKIADDALAKAVVLEGEVDSLKAKVTALEAADNASQDDVANVAQEVQEFAVRVHELFGQRLTSITLEPTFNVHGIPTIKFNTLGFVPQVFEEDHGPYASVTMPVDKAELITIDGGNTIAEYRLSPRYIDKKSIGFPYLESIVSENIELLPFFKSVDSDKAFKNSPIAPVEGQDLEITDEGILKLKVTKTIDEFLGSEIEFFYSENFYEYQSKTGATEMVDVGGIKERFYFASLGIPIAEEYLTEEEKAEGGAVVTSEHYRVEEFLNRPKIKSTIAEDEILTWFNPNTGEKNDGSNHYVPYALDKDGKPVHYSSLNLLIGTGFDELVDTVAYWKEGIDLTKLVTVCTVDDHATLEDYADYGLEFRFRLADVEYLQGDNKTDQQKFAEIDANGFMTSKVYTIDGETETAKGREPIVEVSLINTKKDNKLVDMRFIKVQWGDKPAEPQVLDPYTFDAQTVSCDYIENRLGTQAVNERIYRQVEKMWGISKDEFHDLYKDYELVDLVRGNGTYIIKNGDSGSLSNEVDNESSTADIIFYHLEDGQSNMSWNYVWKMSPAAVGTIVPAEKETYTLTVKFIDKTASKVKGDILMDFIMDVTIPTQEFAYQGTFWRNGVGEGVFNVNPLVYRPDSHGNDLPNKPEVGSSHIDTDLVNGYIFKDTKKKPVNLAEFINHLEGCAEVNFIFDDSRFSNYAYLSDYTVTPDKASLWYKTDDPANITNFDYVVSDALAASINNKFGALANRKPSLYKDNINPLLGTEDDEATAIIRLHEKEGEELGTEGAIGLIGKNVPVNLVVAYNEFNEVAVQEFEVHFIDPLKIDGAISDQFTDAVVGGSFVNVEKGFTFTDWNFYKVAKGTVGTVEKEKWAPQLYNYYAVNNVIFDTKNVKTSLTLVGDTYIHQDGTTDGNLPTDASLTQVNDAGESVESDPTQLRYDNALGTPVNVDYNMFIDVSVDYKWGTLTKPGLMIHVNKAEGTPTNGE